MSGLSVFGLNSAETPYTHSQFDTYKSDSLIAIYM